MTFDHEGLIMSSCSFQYIQMLLALKRYERWIWIGFANLILLYIFTTIICSSTRSFFITEVL